MLSSAWAATVRCPAGHFPATPPASNATACKSLSYPLIRNDLFWQNRAFHISVGGPGGETLNQQNLVTLAMGLPPANAAVPNQASTGQCVSGPTVWDIGYRGDTGPTKHNGTEITLAPQNSILTSTAGGYGGNGNVAAAANPGLISLYCNGSRVPPENLEMGYIVPAGVSDATLPNPVFNLTAAATVDEGNNSVPVVFYKDGV